MAGEDNIKRVRQSAEQQSDGRENETSQIGFVCAFKSFVCACVRVASLGV